jgi:hypothetical protein
MRSLLVQRNLVTRGKGEDMSKEKAGVSEQRRLSRRGFLRNGLAAGAIVAGASRRTTTAEVAIASPEAASTGQPEDIRSSQNTLLEALIGQVEKVRLGERAFLDAPDLLAYLPQEFLARSFVRSNKGSVNAVCKTAGYVYAVTASKGPQAGLLAEKGFKHLDFREFQVFKDGSGKAVAFQKLVSEGESLAFGDWVILIFGPEERGGVPHSKMRSLAQPAFLPDGSEFKTWEVPLESSRTYHVDQSHPQASDNNSGTKDSPFKTINRAAQVLQPGERVLVATGVYRECVRPLRGGSDPEHMISYEAAPEARVVIKGSELLKAKWVKSVPWVQDNRTTQLKPTVQDIWMVLLPPELFAGYNPFGITNYRQVNQMPYWNLPEVFSDPKAKVYLQVSGLMFQNGRRLTQVSRYTDLFTTEGAFWVETNGMTIHVSPYGGVDPNQAEWEVTAREQIFAPEEYHLGYIRVKGFTMQHAGNSFPFPQRGAISTMIGHHWIIEDNTIEWVNSVGIDIGDQGEPPSGPPEVLGYHIVRRNTLNDIGTTGVTGPKPSGTLIEDNVFRRNAWHDAEMLAECAAIKTHSNLNVLIRRNLIFDTLHASGIWIDSGNSNCRICQNVIVCPGSNVTIVRGLGGIMIEASMAPNLVDRNLVWGSIYSNGIYAYTSSKLTVGHNLVGNCAGAGIMILDVPGRPAGDGGTIPTGNNKALSNILVNNGWDIEFYSANNLSDHNLFGRALHPDPFHFNVTVANPSKAPGKNQKLDLDGWRKSFGLDIHSSEAEIWAEFDPATLELTWSVQGNFTEGMATHGMADDFWGRPSEEAASPGPFGSLPKQKMRIVADPRPARR